jgi:60 kDa SS-A/Ro ribonucleoprotein
MKTNAKPPKIHTHEGAVAVRISPIEELRRTVSACLLWESSFYESGVSIADRIQKLALEVDLNDLIALISETRDVHKLRHAPLMLLAAMLQRSDLHTFKGSIPDVIAQNIRRADEMGELLAMHAQLTNTPIDKLKKILPAKLKKGLAKAFNRFDAYQLGKYNRPDGIKLRDVMLLTHPKPSDDAQAAVWKSLLDGTLA